jgi:hypothetical protein
LNSLSDLVNRNKLGGKPIQKFSESKPFRLFFRRHSGVGRKGREIESADNHGHSWEWMKACLFIDCSAIIFADASLPALDQKSRSPDSS